MPSHMQPKPITAYLDLTLISKLESLMKADDRSMSWLVATACAEFIAKPENVAKWKDHNHAQITIDDVLKQGARAKKRSSKKGGR